MRINVKTIEVRDDIELEIILNNIYKEQYASNLRVERITENKYQIIYVTKF